MQHKSPFTAENVWRGGHYELLIEANEDSSEQVCSLLRALWSHPSLDGCFLRNDNGPSAQLRVQPCENAVAGHLYGLALLPNKRLVACGSYAMDYGGEGEFQPAHWVSFYVPLGALADAYPVGAYPFGPMEGVSEWKMPMDSFFAEVAMWVYDRVPFEFGLIGFEVVSSGSLLQTIRAGRMPEERSDGILWSNGGELKWYPATRP